MDYHLLLKPLTNILFDINVSIREYEDYDTKVVQFNDSSFAPFTGKTDYESHPYIELTELFQLILSTTSSIEKESRNQLFEVGSDWEVEVERLIESTKRLVKLTENGGYKYKEEFKYYTSFEELAEEKHRQEIQSLAMFISAAILNLHNNLKLIRTELNRYSLKPITETQTELKKITYNGSPSIFGYLMLQLIEQQHIEPPFSKGEISYRGLAKLCYKYFDIKCSEEVLIKAFNEKSNQLSDTKKAKFTIPSISDLN